MSNISPEMKTHIDECCQAVLYDGKGKYEIHLPQKIKEPLFGRDSVYVYKGIPFEIVTNPAIMDFCDNSGVWTTDLWVVDRTALPQYTLQELQL